MTESDRPQPTNPSLEAQKLHAGAQVGALAIHEVGPAAQSFYDADGHFMGRSLDGEYRLIVTDESEQPPTDTAVGTGETPEAALHDSFTAMRSLETVRTKPLIEIQITETASVQFTELEHYAPKSAPGSDVYHVPAYAENLIKDAKGGLGTYEKTVEQEGWQEELAGIVSDYLSQNPTGISLRESLGITSLKHLTPEQAVKLSASLVQNVSKYSRDEGKSPSRSDGMTAMELLREGITNKSDKNWGGNGICRNVASNVKAVFEALKATQGELSMLNNTYSAYGAGHDGAGYEDSRPDFRAFNMDAVGHAWNTFTTVGEDGSVSTTIIDATWALNETPADALSHIDYTKGRAGRLVSEIFAQTEQKGEAFYAVAHYFQRVAAKTIQADISQASKERIREFALSEYLKSAVKLVAEVPDDYLMPPTPSILIAVAQSIPDKLEKYELQAMYAIDTAADRTNQERISRIARAYAQSQPKRVQPEWKKAGNLLFDDIELQSTVLDALKSDDIQELAKHSGEFRARIRERTPDVFPDFDPLSNPADARELRYFANLGGLRDMETKRVIGGMKKDILARSGSQEMFDAITAGRSDYDLAKNFAAIKRALTK